MLLLFIPKFPKFPKPQIIIKLIKIHKKNNIHKKLITQNGL